MPERFDACKVLGAVSGLGEQAARDVLVEVRANLDKLDRCAGPHQFQKEPEQGSLHRKYRCLKCDGIVHSTEYRWYQQGLQHGQRRED